MSLNLRNIAWSTYFVAELNENYLEYLLFKQKLNKLLLGVLILIVKMEH